MTPERKQEAREWSEILHPTFGNYVTSESEAWWKNARDLMRELLEAQEENEKLWYERRKR